MNNRKKRLELVNKTATFLSQNPDKNIVTITDHVISLNKPLFDSFVQKRLFLGEVAIAIKAQKGV